MTAQTVGIWTAFVKAHEKLLIVLMLVVLAAFAVDKGINAWVEHDKRASTAQDAANVIVQNQLTQAKADNAALNARLDAALVKRAQATVKQKAVDKTLPPAQLASRIQALLQSGKVQVSTVPSALPNTLEFDAQASEKVASDEEDLLQLRADNTDLNTKIVACTTLGTQKDAALVSEQTTHALDVKTLKAQNHKSWLNGFKWGAVAGFVGGVVTLHKL